MLANVRYKIRFVSKADRAMWTLVGQLVAVDLQMDFEFEAFGKDAWTFRALKKTFALMYAILGAQRTPVQILDDMRASVLHQIRIFHISLRTVGALMGKFPCVSEHVGCIDGFVRKAARAVGTLVGEIMCVY